MKKRNVLLAALFVLVVLVLGYRFHQKASSASGQKVTTPGDTLAVSSQNQNATPALTPSTAKMTQAEATQSLIQQEAEREKKVWDLLFLTPISFYGKVIDEKRNPIPDANVSISFVDSLGDGEKHTKGSAVTDDDGQFHVAGHGLAVVINASKAGYYRIKQSGGAFGYSKEGGPIDPHPDATSPAILVLRKMGQTVPLIHLERDYSISKEGRSVEVSLTTGKVVPSGQGDLKIEAWTNDQGHQPNSNTPYDWRCRISILGGGLILRQGEFNFEASEGNYAPSDEINMPASAGAQWRSQVSRQYFVQLSGNRYARLEFEMTAGGDHFFGIKSYLNPTPGDRNLEFDPAKAITPPR